MQLSEHDQQLVEKLSFNFINFVRASRADDAAKMDSLVKEAKDLLRGADDAQAVYEVTQASKKAFIARAARILGE